jgi:hypothetical protein
MGSLDVLLRNAALKAIALFHWFLAKTSFPITVQACLEQDFVGRIIIAALLTLVTFCVCLTLLKPSATSHQPGRSFDPR